MSSVLEIIKKNLLSLICAVITILAIVGVFWPLGSKFDQLRASLQKSNADLSSLNTLATKTRHFPLTDPSQVEQTKLDVFPIQPVIDVASQITQDIAAQSKAVLDLAAKLNEHTLLVPGTLPTPTPFLANKYQLEYQRQVDFLNSDMSLRNQSLPMRVLHAGLPPTEQEITAEAARRAKDITDNQLIVGANDKSVESQIQQVSLTIADDMRRDVATKSQIYMNPDSIDIYPGVLGTATAPPPASIYYSQVGLWVQEDVFDGLAAANAKAHGVMEAPVKHLIKIEVEEDGKSATGAPPADASGAVHTPTGRASNTTYDVIPFKLTINVDVTQIPQVLANLSKNRFITVTRCDMSTVDSGSMALAGYYYGPNPVVQLSIDGEELLLKSWTSKYAPASVTAAPAAPQ